MSGTMLLTVLLGLAVLVALGYVWGRRTNQRIAKAYSRALEELFDPPDRSYAWIGGTIGFHATYRLASGRWVKASLVMPPRQSPLYLPFSLLLFGGERLFVSVGLDSLKARAELIAPGARSVTRKATTDPSQWSDKRQVSMPTGAEATLYSQTARLRAAIEEFLVVAGKAARRLKHVSLDMEPDPRLYVFLRPREPRDVLDLKSALQGLVKRLDKKPM